MNTEAHQITVSGLRVNVVRKAIKNLHLGVYPPEGQVRVAAPLAVSDEAVRRAVIGKLGWIKRQQAKFDAQPRQSKREMVSGESHYFLGRRYRFRVLAHEGAARVAVRGNGTIEMRVRPEATAEQRERALQQWYREQLKAMVPPLVEKWQERLGVQITDWGIRRMKTKWGTCNIEAGRIWLNVELAKKPPECLEYIIVHELVHLIERHHNERFIALLDQFLPQWRLQRQLLNAAPLAHETWPAHD
jgi:hypothetical protein